MIIPIERLENIGSSITYKALKTMRDTLEVDERYVKNSCLNEEKSERHLFEKDLSLFILLIIYGLS